MSTKTMLGQCDIELINFEHKLSNITLECCEEYVDKAISCETEPNICSSNEVCISNGKTFTCKCIKNCDQQTRIPSEVSCLTHPDICTDSEKCTKLENEFLCQPIADESFVAADANEITSPIKNCKLQPDICNENQECLATVNGEGFECYENKYKVSDTPCDDGFRRSLNGTCLDIDECTLQNPCPIIEDICTNTYGRYHCHTVKCPPMYLPYKKT